MQDPSQLINPDNLSPEVPEAVTNRLQLGKQWREQTVKWEPKPVLYDMQDRGYTLPASNRIKPKQPKGGRLNRLLQYLGV